MTWTAIKIDALLFGGIALLSQSVPWQWIGGVGGLIALVSFVAAVTYKHMSALGRLEKLEDWRREHSAWGVEQLRQIEAREQLRAAEFRSLLELTRQQSLQLARIETALECEPKD